MQSDYGNLGNESKSDSTLYKYEKLNGGDHSTHVKRPSLKESVLSNHFSVTRGHDEKIVIQWENINYTMLVKDTVRSKFMNNVNKEKTILRDVSGHAESGELVAIMGPTGCGKTSLLNILAARIPSVEVHNVKCTGSVKLNSKLRDEEKFRRISAYVLQDDNLYAHLTVFETFFLAANFYLADDVTQEKRIELVEAVIVELGLVKVRDTIIGDEKMRGVSGGERKRTSIGVQLIADPAVLFLDEPTSGLDSFQALSVMESMRSLSENGRLVITVIHQPRSSIFQMFDKLVLLSEGRCAYFGTCDAAVDYFATINYNCPESFNPSDYFLDILSPDNRSIEAQDESKIRINSLLDTWEQCTQVHVSSSTTAAATLGQKTSSSSRSNTTQETITKLKQISLRKSSSINMSSSSSSVTATDVKDPHNTTNQSSTTTTTTGAVTLDVLTHPPHKTASILSHDSVVSNINDIKIVGSSTFTIERRWRNMKLLAWRTFAEQSRDVATIGFKMIFAIIFALIIGGIYSNIGNSQRSIQNRYGLLFFVVINQIFPSVMAVFNSFPKEANIVNRERGSKAYDALSYFVSKVIIEIPLNIVPCGFYTCIIYWMVDLNPALDPSRFLLFILILMYTVTTGIALGLCISAAMGSVDAAVALGMPLLIISILFGGFYITVPSLPIVLNWFTYISIIRWSFEALCINEFVGLTFTCNGLSNANCISTGEQALGTLGFNAHTVSYPIFGLSMLLIGFLLLGYFFLARRKSVFLKLGHIGKKIQTHMNNSSQQFDDDLTSEIIISASPPASTGGAVTVKVLDNKEEERRDITYQEIDSKT